MSALKQLLAFRPPWGGESRYSLKDLLPFVKGQRWTLKRPLASLLLLGTVVISLLFACWIGTESIASMQADYAARQQFLGSLQKKSEVGTLGLKRRGFKGVRDIFLRAPTETLAAAALDDELRRVAVSTQATILSSHPEVDRNNQNAGNVIQIKAVMEGKIDALQALLFRLETETPMIFVQQLTLETGDSEVADGASDPVLHAAATFVAYWNTANKPRAQR